MTSSPLFICDSFDSQGIRKNSINLKSFFFKIHKKIKFF
jgi:hypothetical protein